MATTWTTALWFLPFVLPIVLWVSWSDMATMKIPNKAVLSLLAVFAIIGLIALPFSDYLWRWAHFGVILILGFVMASIGGVGAGDAKFAAAMAPFMPLKDLGVFVWVLAATIFAAFVLHRLARASKLRQVFPDWESWEQTKKFPMGLALAPSLLFYLLLALAEGRGWINLF